LSKGEHAVSERAPDDDEEMARERARVRLAAPQPESSDTWLTLGSAIVRELGFTVGVAIALTTLAAALIWLLFSNA
jgi:hypothetical protein